MRIKPVLATLTAASSASKASAKVGTIVAVNGSVAHLTGTCPVYLQRLYGRTQWRTVSTAKTRQSGRFNAQPAYKGVIPYRAYFPSCQPFAVGISTIQGT
jgi:hypothetical protein